MTTISSTNNNQWDGGNTFTNDDVTLAGPNWTAGIVRNAYLRVDGNGASTITSVAFRNNSGDDFLLFDRLALQSSVPEPGTFGLLAAAGLFASKALWMRSERRKPSIAIR